MMPTETVEPAVADGTAPAAPVTNRRSFLAMGAAAAGLAVASTANAQKVQIPEPRTRKPGASGSQNLPTDGTVTWNDPVLRLIRRITSGLTTAEIASARQMGFSGYLNYQLNPAAISDTAVDTFVTANFPLLALPYTTMVTMDSGEVSNQLMDNSLYRAAFSKRQLQERMIDFWTDHFTISLNKVGIRKAIDDRDVIRPFALGKFPDLLRATSKSPAMLVYLDQNLSKFPTPNQNYAREVMELHTLGVNGGYTQDRRSRVVADSHGMECERRELHVYARQSRSGAERQQSVPWPHVSTDGSHCNGG